MRITDVWRLTGASVGLGLVGLCVVQSATAQIVVDTPITTQVTDTTDGQTITVTLSGSITTSGATEAIYSDNLNVTITNNGSIATEDGEGIFSDNNGATITNTGDISTQNAVGINSRGDDATIINNGSITSLGSDEDAIAARGDNALVINTGSITTLGRSATGIFGASNVTNTGSITAHADRSRGISARNITNSGTITVHGEDAQGIQSSGNVTNGGTIIAEGTDALGISSSGDDATIFNSGRIDSTGIGIESQGDNVVITNSGRVVSASGQSIFFEDPAAAFNLLPGSFLGGTVVMDGGVMPVNITTGPSHSTLTLFATAAGGLPNFTGGAPNFSGPVPGFYNAGAGQTATYDPTVLARMGGMTQDLAGGISGQVGGRFAPSAPSATRFANAFAAADPASEEDAGAFDGFVSTYNPTTGSVHGAWVSGFGSFSSQDGNQAALDSDSWAAGLSVGYDQVINPSLTLGVLAGFSTATLQADSRWVAGTVDHDAQGGYVGIYGRYAPSALGWYVDGALLAGFLAHENVRFVNDNMAVGGVSSARSDYDSWWIAPELGVGYTHDTAENWKLTPSAQIRLAVQSFDGYSETGPSAANATIGSWISSSLQTRLQLAASYTSYSGVRITGRLGAYARTDIGDDSVSTTLIGQTQAIPTFADDTLAGFVGLEGDYALTDTTSLNFSTEFSASSAGTRVSAGLHFRVMF